MPSAYRSRALPFAMTIIARELLSTICLIDISFNKSYKTGKVESGQLYGRFAPEKAVQL
ncbi:MAG: hypothetical protein GQF41_2223 [Candidatus Rifleibacterium amylolyticum]|nr:MAG: hypothetical protein GQF41_2223 [Candidatus Rifleibacterium amylolyticum]